MARSAELTDDLFQDQLNRLGEGHFQILCWCSMSEAESIKYNITNCFDDLKHANITRTKQTAMAAIEATAIKNCSSNICPREMFFMDEIKTSFPQSK